jgi:hypothetical protein
VKDLVLSETPVAAAVSKVFEVPNPIRSMMFALLRTEPPAPRLMFAVVFASQSVPFVPPALSAAAVVKSGVGSAVPLAVAALSWIRNRPPPATVPPSGCTPLAAPVPAVDRYWIDLPVSETGEAEVFQSSTKSAFRTAPALPPLP